MAWDRESRFAPFGWAIACEGAQGRGREELTALVRWVEDTWRACFPAGRGYRISAAGDRGDEGLRLSVCRGDFRAEVAIEGATGADPRLRMFGTATSEAIRRSERRARTTVLRARNVGAVLGLVVFFGVCWAVIGRYEPHYPLSGMLMVLMLLFSLVAGGGIGTWVAERLAEARCRRARHRADGNHELQHDLDRWKSLSRLLAQQREVIAGRRRRQPFRSEA